MLTKTIRFFQDKVKNADGFVNFQPLETPRFSCPDSGKNHHAFFQRLENAAMWAVGRLNSLWFLKVCIVEYKNSG